MKTIAREKLMSVERVLSGFGPMGDATVTITKSGSDLVKYNSCENLDLAADKSGENKHRQKTTMILARMSVCFPVSGSALETVKLPGQQSWLALRQALRP